MYLKTKTGRKVKVPTPEENAAINAGIAADADTRELSAEEFAQLKPAKPRGRPVGSGSKVQLTVRFDSDLVEEFKQGGEGWQTRMNNALREWLQEHH